MPKIKKKIMVLLNLYLTMLEKLSQKNYFLRDSYYNMERDVQKSLSNYHIILRDYQYDIEIKIKEIIKVIKSKGDKGY